MRLIYVVLLSSLLACSHGNRVQKLTERADSFNRGLRWGSVTAASTLIAEDVRRTLAQEIVRKLGRARIVDYSIIDLGVDEEGRLGTVVVEFSFYDISDQDLRYRQELQNWQWDSKKKEWFLASVRDLPQRQ